VTATEATTVRPATPEDTAAVLALTLAAFAEHAELTPTPGALAETEATVARDLAGDGGLVLTGPDGDLLAALRFSRDDPVRWVRRVAVAPTHQRRGLGARLMAAAADVAASQGATALRCKVRLALPGNERFYAGLGFRPLAAHDHWREWGLPLARPVPTAAATRALAERLAAALAPGDLVILDGPLGAGKTEFAQGIGAGLGVTGPVTSPTFVISRRHRGTRADLLHADAYRLGTGAEFDDLDLDSELPGAVTVVEWGSGVAEGLAQDRIVVRIERSDAAPPDGATPPADEPRRITLTAHGPGAAARQRQLDAITAPVPPGPTR
jgi:tRNA threonylcarbamoyladenosine biosynthesis protein TsaE